jgi:hypothetical protein
VYSAKELCNHLLCIRTADATSHLLSRTCYEVNSTGKCIFVEGICEMRAVYIYFNVSVKTAKNLFTDVADIITS